ncbi:MAG: hypothetical protein AAB250_16995 [Bdellovibrionota bacterium]
MITSFLIFAITCLYSAAPRIEGGLDPGSQAALLAHIAGPVMAGVAVVSAFPSAWILKNVNTCLGAALILSPALVPSWPPNALVIQVIVGLLVMGLSLLPRRRDPIVTGGGWRHVFSSPSTIDRIQTSFEL